MKFYEESLIARKKADAECIANLFAESLNDYKTEDLHD